MSKDIKHLPMASLNRDELFAIKQIFKGSKTYIEFKPLVKHYQTKKGYYGYLVESAFLTLIKPYLKGKNLDLSGIRWRNPKKNKEGRIIRVDICHNEINACECSIDEIDEDGFRSVVEIAFILFLFHQGDPEYGNNELREHLSKAIRKRPWLEKILMKAGKGENEFEKLAFLFIGAVCEGL